MEFKIIPLKQFSKDFKKIKDVSAQRAIKNKIEEVCQNPARYKRLRYGLSGSFRIRVLKYRVLYSIDEGLGEMYLEKIVFDHRY